MRRLRTEKSKLNNSAKLKAEAVWGTTPAGAIYGNGFVVGTKDFFENVIHKRFEYEVPFIRVFLDEYELEGKRILDIGAGTGYDLFEFHKRGALVYGIDITSNNMAMSKKHLSYYGYSPSLVVADAESLPFRDESFDFIYSFGVLHHTLNITQALEEAHRVAKRGAEGIIAVYNKNSIFYWVKLLAVDYILKAGFLRQSFNQRLSEIEYTENEELPLVNVYSKRQIRKILRAAGFLVDDICVRKLLREDLPTIRYIAASYEYIPTWLLAQLGKIWGWYLICRVYK